MIVIIYFTDDSTKEPPGRCETPLVAHKISKRRKQMEQIVSEPETEFDLLGGSSAPRPRVAERLYLANERIRAVGAGPRERRYIPQRRATSTGNCSRGRKWAFFLRDNIVFKSTI